MRISILETAEWRYFVTKTKSDHLVPLSLQAVKILRELYPLTGRSAWVFPDMRDHKKPMSEATINAALRRMGYDTKTEITGHGFRWMARTILHEELHVKPEVIEHQLAHRVPDALGTAHNRTKFLKERRLMMQQWSDYLDLLRKAGADRSLGVRGGVGLISPSRVSTASRRHWGQPSGCSARTMGSLIICSARSSCGETWYSTLLPATGVAVSSTTQLGLSRPRVLKKRSVRLLCASSTTTSGLCR